MKLIFRFMLSTDPPSRIWNLPLRPPTVSTPLPTGPCSLSLSPQCSNILRHIPEEQATTARVPEDSTLSLLFAAICKIETQQLLHSSCKWRLSNSAVLHSLTLALYLDCATKYPHPADNGNFSPLLEKRVNCRLFLGPPSVLTGRRSQTLANQK